MMSGYLRGEKQAAPATEISVALGVGIIHLLPRFAPPSELGFLFNSTTSRAKRWQLCNLCYLLSVHQFHPQILTLFRQPLPLMIPPNSLAQRVSVSPSDTLSFLQGFPVPSIVPKLRKLSVTLAFLQLPASQ